METAIWIIIAAAAAIIGYVAAAVISKKNASSRANSILEDANREAEVIKEKRILQAKEEEMKILGEAERNAGQDREYQAILHKSDSGCRKRRRRKPATSSARCNSTSSRTKTTAARRNLTLSRATSTTARL